MSSRGDPCWSPFKYLRKEPAVKKLLTLAIVAGMAAAIGCSDNPKLSTKATTQGTTAATTAATSPKPQ
jgi:hypothetical protein